MRGVVVNLGHNLVEVGVGGSVEDDPGGALVVVIEHEDDRVAPPPLLRLGARSRQPVSASGRRCAQSEGDICLFERRRRSNADTTWLL